MGHKEATRVKTMEWTWSFFVWTTIVISPTLLLLLLHHHRRKSATNRQPPGPPGWPVVGHLFSLGAMPHRTLAGLKPQYGDVIWLKLGSINTMVVLSAKAATELFKNNDLSFIDRTIKTTMRSRGYNNASLALSPYGTYWRVLKKICTVEMVVAKRINETVSIRRRCVDDMLSWITKEAEVARVVHVTRFVFLASFNLLGNLMLSRDLVDPESEVGSEMLSAITSLMRWSGHPNISDLFPWLRWLDLQGLRKKMDRDLGNALRIASGFVKERMKERQEGSDRRKDFLDVLLEFDGNGTDDLVKLSEHQINAFILVKFNYLFMDNI